jgi:hypothetical protein
LISSEICQYLLEVANGMHKATRAAYVHGEIPFRWIGFIVSIR